MSNEVIGIYRTARKLFSLTISSYSEGNMQLALQLASSAIDAFEYIEKNHLVPMDEEIKYMEGVIEKIVSRWAQEAPMAAA